MRARTFFSWVVSGLSGIAWASAAAASLPVGCTEADNNRADAFNARAIQELKSGNTKGFIALSKQMEEGLSRACRAALERDQSMRTRCTAEERTLVLESYRAMRVSGSSRKWREFFAAFSALEEALSPDCWLAINQPVHPDIRRACTVTELDRIASFAGPRYKAIGQALIEDGSPEPYRKLIITVLSTVSPKCGTAMKEASFFSIFARPAGQISPTLDEPLPFLLIPPVTYHGNRDSGTFSAPGLGACGPGGCDAFALQPADGRPPPPPPPPPLNGKPTAAMDREFTAYWNAWFEQDLSVVDRLELKKTYRFVLDLSRYQRKPGASVTVSGSAREVLKTSKNEANFTVRVLFAGGAIRLADGQASASAQRLKVLVPRMFQTDLSVAELREWQAGRLNTSIYLNKASAGNIGFDVIAVHEGCGAVTMSVWDSSGLRPLDHVTYEYAVGYASQCPGSGRLASGFDMALSISSLLDGGEGDKADAAFHIFELPQSVRDQGSVVWFVDRAEFEAAEKSGTFGGVYAWQTQSSIKQFVQSSTQLPALLEAARAAAAAGHERPYENVAADLGKKLFSVENEETYGAAARDAHTALKRLVNDAASPPVVLVRLAVSADALDYLPLGLLTARAEKPVFRQPFVTVQPLRRERFYQGKACVDPWTLGLPAALQGLDVDVQRQLKEFDLESARWPYTFARSIKALQIRFGLGQEVATEKATAIGSGAVRGEGVVLLAHHADGNLWFDQQLDRLVQEDFQRTLPRGSVAILSACSVGGPGPLSYKLIEKLNSQNVDAMIVSPFPVRADFGALLALNFVIEIDEAHRARRTPTIVELYSMALARTAVHFRKFKRDFDDMGLEFVILGDPSIRLCAD